MPKLLLPPLPRSPMFIGDNMTTEWQNFFWGVYTRFGEEGTAALVPKLDYMTQIAQSKPTLTTRGAHKGFSLPVYSSDNEELFFNSVVPTKWDKVSDLNVELLVSISGAEDVGDKFNLQLSWDRVHEGEAVMATLVDVEVETTITTSNSAAYSVYQVKFPIAYDVSGREIYTEDLLSCRIRRIAASSLEVSNEIIAWML